MLKSCPHYGIRINKLIYCRPGYPQTMHDIYYMCAHLIIRPHPLIYIIIFCRNAQKGSTGSEKQVINFIGVTLFFPQKLQGAGHLSVMTLSLDGLLKYTINLIIPKRPSNWRSINTANTFFKNHNVAYMKGHEKILRTAGYSEKEGFSLKFPDTVQEPDQAQLSILAAELLMARLEVEQMSSEAPEPKQEIATISWSTSHNGMMTLQCQLLVVEKGVDLTWAWTGG